MTTIRFSYNAEPVPHGFHAVLRDGFPDIAIGSTSAHGRQLRAYQTSIAAAAVNAAQTEGHWPHYNVSPIGLLVLVRRLRPTTYAAGETFHRTNRGGDLTTILRAVEDALEGVLYRNDGQVAVHLAAKIIGTTPGVDVAVAGLDDEAAFAELLAAYARAVPASTRRRTGTTGPANNPTPQGQQA